MILLRNGGTATEAVEAAIKSLEDNEITNAGYGSNLNVHGEPEMDAVIVEGTGMSGGVACVRGTFSPVDCRRIHADCQVQMLKIRLYLLAPSSTHHGNRCL